MARRVGVIYETTTREIRWLHVPDEPGQETIGVNLLPGEAIIVLLHDALPVLQQQVKDLP